jgi:hypothetical protein
MTGSKFNNAILPGFLSRRAYVSSSGQEFALPADAALDYLRWAQERGIEVLGVDAWRPTIPGPTALPGIGCDGGSQACIAAIPQIVAELGQDIVFNIWTKG